MKTPAGVGVSIQGGGGNVIAGNWIGTDTTGSVANANFEGVVVEGSDNNRIGGTAAADRNVISGNGLDGVRFDGGTGNVLSGNYIGLNAAGDAALGNGLSGVNVEAGTGPVIGGTTAGAGNTHERTPGNRARPLTDPLPVQQASATHAVAVPFERFGG